MKISIVVLIPLLVVVANVAPAQDPSASSPQPGSSVSTVQQPRLAQRSPRYRIRKSDSIDIQFALSPEFNQTVSVQPDGYITLKAVGTIVAEGLTLPELTTAIHNAYAGTLHDPIVTIELRDFDKPYFIATGQVAKPGKYDLRSDLTLTQGVAVAGGFTEASKHSQVVLFRPSENGMTEARLIDAKKLLSSRNLNEDIHLLPGDMIYVPQNRISKISRYLPTTSLGLYAYPGAF